MPTITRAEAGAAWGAMLAGGTVCAVVLALAAWPLEHAVGMPGLAPVMAAMAVSIVLGVAATAPRALLERELRYGRVAAIESTATALAAAIGVAAAWAGAGVWSLVIYTIVTHVVRAGAFAWSSRRDLALNMRLRTIAPLLSFGGWVLVTNLLNFVARNSDNLLIGAWLGAAALGVYGLSYQFMLAPLMAITWPTSAILLATLRARDPAGEDAQRTLRGIVSATAMVTVPAMLFLTFGLAWPVAALLSPRWAAVPSIVMWLAPAGALQSVASYNGAVLLAAGKARAQFILTVANTVLLLTTFLIALPFGLDALVHAYAIAITISSLAFFAMMAKLTRLGWRPLLRAVAPGALVGGGALCAVLVAFGGTPMGWPRWAAATLLYGTIVLGGYALLGPHVRRTLAVLMAGPPVAATGT